MAFFPIEVNFPFRKPMVLLEDFPEESFKAPFLSRVLKENILGKRNIKALSFDLYEKYLNENSILKPSGFIFHTSRTGSTLVGQMLSELNNCRVVSESSVLNNYFSKTCIKNIGDYKRRDYEKLFLGYSISYKAPLEHLFFKFPSWAVHFMSELLKIFPNTPWIYLYRDPLEVIVSNLQKKSFQFDLKKKHPAFSTYLTQLPHAQIKNYSEEQLIAKLLERNLDSILKILPAKNGMILNYQNIKSSFEANVLPHLKIKPTRSES